ncbi:MAG: YgaP-like transmembrane domain [Psychrobium sp.]
MTYQRATFMFAGIMIILSVVLTQMVHPNFVYFTLFIGLNMMQFSISKFCPASWLFKRLGMKSDCDNVAAK